MHISRRQFLTMLGSASASLVLVGYHKPNHKKGRGKPPKSTTSTTTTTTPPPVSGRSFDSSFSADFG